MRLPFWSMIVGKDPHEWTFGVGWIPGPKKAGFDKTIYPHQFRHACATVLLESGVDLRSIQKLLGHSSIQTTQIYTSVSTQKMQETVDQHHPLSSFIEG